MIHNEPQNRPNYNRNYPGASPAPQVPKTSGSRGGTNLLEVVAVIVVIVAAAAYFLFPKGVHSHVWQEATCTSARECQDCGETEGEPLGHDWMAATIQTSETCSRCGKTRGISLMDSVLADAERYAREGDYRWAIQLLDEAWEEHGLPQFRDSASDYRLEFSNYHSSHVAAGKYNTILIYSDGRISIVGDNTYRELDAADWTEIAAAGAGDEYVAALRRDGTVVAAGKNRYDEYTGVKSWRNVVAISTGDFHLAALLSDGTVIAAPGFDHCGQAEVDLLMDAARGVRIVAISAGYDHTLALLEDGTAVACGDRPTGQNKQNGVCNVSHWRQIAAICSGTEFCAGLRTDGTVLVAGANWDMSDWKDISGLAAGDFFLVGLQEDGTVRLQVEQSDYSTEEIKALSRALEWENVVYIAAGHNQIIGICADGTVRCAGVNEDGQCALNGTVVSLEEQIKDGQ